MKSTDFNLDALSVLFSSDSEFCEMMNMISDMDLEITGVGYAD